MKIPNIAIFLFFLSLCFAEQKETTLLYPPFKHTWGVHRGTEAKLDILMGNRTDFENPQGLACVKLKSWDNPKDRKDDDEITAFGVNSGRGEIIYNSSMYSLALYGKSGSEKNEFMRPHGIFATPDGDVYVADTGNRRIVHLRIPKKELRWVRSLGDDSLIEPFDVAVVPGGTLYISDIGRNSVVVMDTMGKFIGEFGKLTAPRGLCANSDAFRWSAYKENCIVVVDSDGKCLTKLNRHNGKVEKAVRMSDIGLPDADLQYIATDYLDNVYVTDSKRCQIHKFDREMSFLTSFGECGTKDEQLDHPRGIAIWRRFGQVIVAESASAQYFWIGVDVRDFDASFDRDKKMFKISLFLTDEAYFTARIEGNKQDRKLGRKRRLDSGRQTVELKIPDDIPEGKYKMLFIIEPTYSSKGHFKKEYTEKVKIQ